MKNKIKIAIELLNEGKGFKIDNLRLEINNNKLSVIGWSKFYILEDISPKNALNEIKEIELSFRKMIENSSDLLLFLKEKTISYNLYYDDSGKGSIIICSLENESFNWYLKTGK